MNPGRRESKLRRMRGSDMKYVYTVESHGINTMEAVYGVFSTVDGARAYAEVCVAGPADGDGYHSFLVVEYMLDSGGSDGTVIWEHEGKLGA